jgi:hypothetical protein
VRVTIAETGKSGSEGVYRSEAAPLSECDASDLFGHFGNLFRNDAGPAVNSSRAGVADAVFMHSDAVAVCSESQCVGSDAGDVSVPVWQSTRLKPSQECSDRSVLGLIVPGNRQIDRAVHDGPGAGA